MARVIYSMMVSLDGFVEDATGGIDWILIDEELHSYVNDQQSSVGAYLHGRRIYELMNRYWPTADADPSNPGYIIDFARIWKAMPKVVFSKTLHDNMRVLAVEGSYASVIGGAPAAAVVFSGEVGARTSRDPRVRALELRLAEAGDLERARLRAELAELRAAVRSEKLGEVAAEFDGVHSIDRAVKVGSVDAVISSRELRPRLIEAVRAGLEQAYPGTPLPLPATPGS